MALSPWIDPHELIDQAPLRLICFNSAGTGSTLFRQWNQRLGGRINALGVQLPGRESRFAEPPAREVASLVEAMGPALAPLFAQPSALLGHSYGALLAFELARWLRRHGAGAPLHLIVAARPAPQLPFGYRKTYHLPEAEFIEVLRRYGGTQDSILANREALRFFLPLIRADLEANTEYRYQDEPPLDCPISGWRGADDPVCSEAELLAWAAQSRAGFRSVQFDGAHFFLHQTEAVLARLSDELATGATLAA
ncbi:thioesterase II family protein [Chitinimonas lacunae]|uniref:Thioesterase II family protein n=1 Tax=Chitinimonas lacunae TaxID=1963018 RepID=A0ABV8MWV9_9NEIS